MQGASGAGKSTRARRAAGLRARPGNDLGRHRPRASTVCPALDPAAWRANLAWVPQRPQPTQPTVAAEVAFGDPSASAHEVADAVADCHAPHPDTLLGEDGVQISAGQRRRVALARALLRARRVRAGGHVPIVLLDEPSEDLDATTERVVASVIAEMSGWATVLIVTHSVRLAGIADRRVVLGGGRLVDDIAQRPVAGTPIGPARDAATARDGPQRPRRDIASTDAHWPARRGPPAARRRTARWRLGSRRPGADRDISMADLPGGAAPERAGTGNRRGGRSYLRPRPGAAALRRAAGQPRRCAYGCWPTCGPGSSRRSNPSPRPAWAAFAAATCCAGSCPTWTVSRRAWSGRWCQRRARW